MPDGLPVLKNKWSVTIYAEAWQISWIKPCRVIHSSN